ncbi:hypothetical protein Dimus_024783, partial [Dionaea muscipula]
LQRQQQTVHRGGGGRRCAICDNSWRRSVADFWGVESRAAEGPTTPASVDPNGVEQRATATPRPSEVRRASVTGVQVSTS